MRLANHDTPAVSESPPSRPPKVDQRPRERDPRSLFVRLVEFLSPGPDSTAELIQTLADAEQRELIEPESRVMLEGVIRMAGMTAGDVMVAVRRMDMLDIDSPYDELLAAVIDTGHSRFPVYQDSRDNIIGVANDNSQQQWGGVVLLGRAPVSDCATGGVNTGGGLLAFREVSLGAPSVTAIASGDVLTFKSVKTAAGVASGAGKLKLVFSVP